MAEPADINQPHATVDGENDQTTVHSVENLETEETAPSCRGCSFPYLLVQALIHLSIYIHKLSEDGYSVSTYYKEKQVYYCIVSVLCLFVPCLVYTAYLAADSILDKKTPASHICTKIINGMLLVPWQIKGVDLIQRYRPGEDTSPMIINAGLRQPLVRHYWQQQISIDVIVHAEGKRKCLRSQIDSSRALTLM